MQRYDFELVGDGGYAPYCQMVKDDRGDYVSYEEAQSRIAQLERALNRACGRMSGRCPTINCPHPDNTSLDNCADHWREWLLESEGE